MGVSLAKKLRWFDRGAAAFERTFPGTLAAAFGADAGPLYVCPICDVAFTRAAVETGELTAEHVPPESFGGRELVLTCKVCNNTAGTLLDAHARRKESIADTMSGASRESMKVRVRMLDQHVQARLETSAGGWLLRVVDKANDPAALLAFKDAGPPRAGHRIDVDFVGARFAELGAKISWFRSGFLALFASAGYRFSFDPALAVAKEQIRTPDRRLIYAFTIVVPQTKPWGEWLVVEIPEPRCTGVLFGKYIVVFPHLNDVGFYERHEATLRARGNNSGVQTVQSFYLEGLEPRFGYDIEAVTD
jgi:hypothetical protein